MANRIKRVPSSKGSAPVYRFKKFGDLKSYKLKERYSKSVVFAQKKPFTTFFITLGILFLVILLGSTIFRTKTPKTATRTAPKNVSVYRMGLSPRISVQGSVIKSGVIKIVAQMPGIVSSVNVSEGDYSEKGTVLINLSSNYSGGNAFTLQRQLAGLQYQNTKDTYETQKDLLAKQREMANQQSENSEELRKITKTSIDETQTLVNLNSEILTTIKSDLQSAINNNEGPEAIQGLQQLQAQLQAGTNQLQSALRASQYQVDENKPPVEMEKLGKEIALKQLDLQEKALKLGLESSGIQLRLAQVQEATMYPAAPFNATIQKVHVKEGDSVNPGMPLVTLSADTGEIVIDAKVTKEVASKVSKIEKSTIYADGKTIELTPSYVSSEATTGQLYSVLFTINEEYKKYFTDGGYVSVSLPLGQSLQHAIPFIPVDSVFQTQDEAFVFVVINNKAKSKKVKLGPVTGGYVTVTEGLSSSDEIILSRTVIDGDEVRIQN